MENKFPRLELIYFLIHNDSVGMQESDRPASAMRLGQRRRKVTRKHWKLAILAQLEGTALLIAPTRDLHVSREKCFQICHYCNSPSKL